MERCCPPTLFCTQNNIGGQHLSKIIWFIILGSDIFLLSLAWDRAFAAFLFSLFIPGQLTHLIFTSTPWKNAYALGLALRNGHYWSWLIHCQCLPVNLLELKWIQEDVSLRSWRYCKHMQNKALVVGLTSEWRSCQENGERDFEIPPARK